MNNDQDKINAKDNKSESKLANEESDVRQAKKRPFQCMFCQKSFQQSCHLKNHVRIHTGEVPFECKTCTKKFKTNCELKRHERIHSGEVPYECKTCRKRFKQKGHLGMGLGRNFAAQGRFGPAFLWAGPMLGPFSNLTFGPGPGQDFPPLGWIRPWAVQKIIIGPIWAILGTPKLVFTR